MKKSIRGKLKAHNQEDKNAIVADINKYVLWRFLVSDETDESGESLFVFEVWVNDETDEMNLWADIKRHCDRIGGKLNRHDCTHDEVNPSPCVISETYTAGW